jgi:hypothetical protein
MTVVEALAERLGVFKTLDDRNRVGSKPSRPTAVTAVFQRAVVVKSRAVPVPWKVEKIADPTLSMAMAGPTTSNKHYPNSPPAPSPRPKNKVSQNHFLNLESRIAR